MWVLVYRSPVPLRELSIQRRPWWQCFFVGARKPPCWTPVFCLRATEDVRVELMFSVPPAL